MTSDIIKQASLANTKVTVIALENKYLRYERVYLSMREAIKQGYWLIIENAQHIIEWPKEVLKLLYQIKDAPRLKEELEMSDDYALNIQESFNSANNNISDNPYAEFTNDKIIIHKNFRLWFVTESDQIHKIPSLKSL